MPYIVGFLYEMTHWFVGTYSGRPSQMMVGWCSEMLHGKWPGWAPVAHLLLHHLSLLPHPVTETIVTVTINYFKCVSRYLGFIKEWGTWLWILNGICLATLSISTRFFLTMKFRWKLFAHLFLWTNSMKPLGSVTLCNSCPNCLQHWTKHLIALVLHLFIM